MDQTPENHNNEKPINRGGRPTKWDESMIAKARLYCMNHHGTDADVAAYLGISCTTFYDYASRYPKFSEAVRDGRKKYCQNGCGNAVRSLYQKVDKQFITVTKVRVKKQLNADGEMVEVERIETTETHVYMPEQRAIEFVLLNKDPENWRLRPDAHGLDDPMLYAEKVRHALKEIDEMHQPENKPEATAGA